MEQGKGKMIILDCLAGLSLEAIGELEKEPVYRSFLSERANLEALARGALADGSGLSTTEILWQEAVVEELGAAVLEMIRMIQFRMTEP